LKGEEIGRLLRLETRGVKKVAYDSLPFKGRVRPL
jgi:hypothetical protein